MQPAPEIIEGHVIVRDALGGYATWDMLEKRWHLNFGEGDSKKGKQVYHVTKEHPNPREHFFFTLDADEISDASPGGQQRGARKFSALPPEVQRFVRANIDDLLPK